MKSKITNLLLSFIFIVLIASIASSATNNIDAKSEYVKFNSEIEKDEDEDKFEWETYSNSKYRFSIDYLKNARIGDIIEGKTFTDLYGQNGTKLFITGGGPPKFNDVGTEVFETIYNKSDEIEKFIQTELDGRPYYSNTEYETEIIDPGTPITVAGLPGKTIKLTAFNLLSIKAAYFHDEDNIYRIMYMGDPELFEEEDEVFNHIVKSFTFLLSDEERKNDKNTNNQNNNDHIYIDDNKNLNYNKDNDEDDVGNNGNEVN